MRVSTVSDCMSKHYKDMAAGNYRILTPSGFSSTTEFISNTKKSMCKLTLCLLCFMTWFFWCNLIVFLMYSWLSVFDGF